MIKFSLVDYPGKIACVVFTAACNFRCPFCHNPHLVLDPESQPRIRDPQIFHFLKSRVGKLDGIVISGGEPTLQKELVSFAKEVSDLGFSIKLDTNGTHPEVLKKLHAEGCLHALGIDYKAPRDKYPLLTNVEDPEIADKVAESLVFALKNGIPLDVRTTVHKNLLSVEDLRRMRKELKELGISDWTLQQFNPVDTIAENLPQEPTYGELELVRIARDLGNTKVRGLTGIYLDMD